MSACNQQYSNSSSSDLEQTMLFQVHFAGSICVHVRA